jgi:hypothetical protein
MNCNSVSTFNILYFQPFLSIACGHMNINTYVQKE